ncbi:hypothetical protein [Flammeovirga kamogawensis]|uniref:Uncharacterized protein n=1 Tax=Flammeovirga kamogawensis TaxID=373891 RepID=A0ABX8GVK1_9BACT|nr:hypothetical protein [Flammeovirga kamogawensis]MBB6459583.1 hypothetical protein [Flammeovirga kamogawensis]QWG07352.1 hypothetical protein KM029_18920 [Flammeovirga kamogawensis]TRX69169.1 hypothetical protein EO216_13920 [Flammeovirga kamogawensis]
MLSKFHTFILFFVTNIICISCQSIDIKDDEKIVIDHKSNNIPLFFPNLKDRFGDDALDIKQVDVKSNNDGIIINADIILKNGKIENRTIKLSPEEMEKVVNRLTTSQNFQWADNIEGNINIELSDNNGRQHRVIKYEKSIDETSLPSDEHLYREEIEDAIQKDYHQSIKTINNMNVEINNELTKITADVTLADGKTVKQVINKSTDHELHDVDEEMKVKMIMIEDK